MGVQGIPSRGHWYELLKMGKRNLKKKNEREEILVWSTSLSACMSQSLTHFFGHFDSTNHYAKALECHSPK